MKNKDILVLEDARNSSVTVAIDGAVRSPGVYPLPSGSLLKDLLISSGGITPSADIEWLATSINLAAPLANSQKYYIPYVWENYVIATTEILNPPSINAQLKETSLINVNIATKNELTSLDGIGDSYSQLIIENRPYANFTEFKENSGLSKSLADKIKGSIEF